MDIHFAGAIYLPQSADKVRVEACVSPLPVRSFDEMPGEDGYTLIRKVRALDRQQGGHIQAVALTAYARPIDRMRALLAGFDIHLPKPVESAQLVTVIASLSGRVGKT